MHNVLQGDAICVFKFKFVQKLYHRRKFFGAVFLHSVRNENIDKWIFDMKTQVNMYFLLNSHHHHIIEVDLNYFNLLYSDLPRWLLSMRKLKSIEV